MLGYHKIQTICVAAILASLMAACSSVPTPKLPFVGGANKDDAKNNPSIAQNVTESTEQVTTETAPPVVPKFVPGDLLGLDVNQLDGLLGTPAFVRQEGLGNYRRYDSQRCNLIVLFERDVSGRTVSAALEAGSFFSSAERPELQDCLNGF